MTWGTQNMMTSQGGHVTKEGHCETSDTESCQSTGLLISYQWVRILFS